VRYSWSIWLVVLLVLSLASAGAAPIDEDGRPRIKKLGTIDLDVVEATPVVFRGKVYRFEWCRKSTLFEKQGDAHPREIKRNYFHFRDRETGRTTPPFAEGYIFGSAFVHGDTVYVTGTSSEMGWTGRRVQMFTSKDLKSWDSHPALDLKGFGICNTSICKAGDKFVMMFEIHKPVEQAGVKFTARFAISEDMREWTVTPPQCVYAKGRYSAPHALRYLDGYYYDFYLEARSGSYETCVVRSKDLIRWEPSPLNPVLRASADDRKIHNPQIDQAGRRRVAAAKNINNSDIDFCEHRGRLIINYSWGDQQGTEHLAEAVYEGTLAQFLQGWFPQRKGD